MQLEVSK
jgi:molecular chaperone DnaK (HSP70)